MIYIAEILLLLGNIAMAAYHADLIKDEKKINHAFWGGLYLAVAVLFSWLNHSWILFVCSLLIRKVVFDLSLNLFLGRQLFYVSTETTSVIDRLHYKLFGKKSELYMSIYFLITIILNVFI